MWKQSSTALFAGGGVQSPQICMLSDLVHQIPLISFVVLLCRGQLRVNPGMLTRSHKWVVGVEMQSSEGPSPWTIWYLVDTALWSFVTSNLINSLNVVGIEMQFSEGGPSPSINFGRPFGANPSSCSGRRWSGAPKKTTSICAANIHRQKNGSFKLVPSNGLQVPGRNLCTHTGSSCIPSNCSETKESENLKPKSLMYSLPTTS